ncbi:MAG: PadR family transcriptional regulator [Terracidiphilus sp.]|jgi:DNA-binding PadR family transcriptional regulator
MTRISILELALIGLIKQQAQSGYDLRKAFATTAMRHFSDSPGAIYPALKRLEKRGWIAAATRSGSGAGDRRRRRVFQLTMAGEAALLERLSRAVSRDDIIWHMPELMLRFAFMDGNVPRSTALRFLDQLERTLGAYIEELRNGYARLAATIPINTGLLAFQSGIEGMEAQLVWARQARARLPEDES